MNAEGPGKAARGHLEANLRPPGGYPEATLEWHVVKAIACENHWAFEASSKAK
jgi:hypothetical protein